MSQDFPYIFQQLRVNQKQQIEIYVCEMRSLMDEYVRFVDFLFLFTVLPSKPYFRLSVWNNCIVVLSKELFWTDLP